jgi:hypothetical protein
MPTLTPKGKSPARVAAGRINGSGRRPWTAEDRERLRKQCLERTPWLRSTGPRTEAGKRQAALNGRCHVSDPHSRRSARAAVDDVRQLVKDIAEMRASLVG